LNRKKTREVNIGGVLIGNDNPIAIQSMNNTDTRDIKRTLEQINKLYEAGCDITRVAIPDMEAVNALEEICRKSPIPVVADIHFDYRLAIESIKRGAAKIRINPGNISDRDKLKLIAKTANEYKIPIRVGVNSGSVNSYHTGKWGGVNENSMTESAMEAIKFMQDCNFDNLVLSIKASDPLLTIKTYRKISDKTNYPLHLGVTEAGTPYRGIIRSAVGIGTLLAEGIGDTIRVSLTGDPVSEIKAGIEILKSLNLKSKGIQIISCPTCGRTSVDLIKIAELAEERFSEIDVPIKIAIMGCAVNGPGEAREADIGIAGGKNEFLLFSKGEIIKKIPQEKAFDVLEQEINKFVEEYRKGTK